METEILQKREKQILPKIRFKEFEKKYSETMLKKAFSIFNGYAFSSRDAQEQGARWVKIADVGINEMKIDNPSFLPKTFIQKHSKFLLRKGDFVVALTRPIINKHLKIAQINDSFDNSLLNQRVGKLISEHHLPYIYYILQKQTLISRIENRIAGTDPPNLSPSVIGSLKIYIPALSEQQKIASFLSAVDKKVQQLTRKKELLETYKKGVMQQLFSQEIRFKDENGKDFPEWQRRKLGEVGKIVSGLTYSPEDMVEDGTLVLRSSNVQSRRLDFNDNVYVNVESFNPVKENDILICVRNGSKRLIGKNAIISKENEGLAFGAFMTVYRSSFNLFLLHFFDSNSYKKEVHKNLGATINSINGSDLKKFKIPFPCLEEQQKIADFLSAIDKKVETVSQQIEKTQTFKKGLLQQMFV